MNYRKGAHKFIQQFAGDPSRPHCPIDEVIITARCAKRARSSSLAHGKETDLEIDNPCSDTSKLLNDALKKKGIVRISTQVRVEHGTGRVFKHVAPILDVLCKDKRGKLVPIEVKTGRIRRLRKKNANDQGASGCLMAWADTIALRHHAQLSVQLHCLKPDERSNKGYLAYFFDARKPPHLSLLSESVHHAIGALDQEAIVWSMTKEIFKPTTF